jgi:hypothetical protein
LKLGTYEKQPRERESYTIEYDDDLTSGDSIASAVAEVQPTGGMVIDDVHTFPNRVRFWAAGGTDKTTYKVTIIATTDDGRVLEDEVTIRVKDH